MVSRKDRTITRAELAEAVGRVSGLPRADSSEIVSQVIGLISETVLQGNPVLLSGFGKFVVVDRAPRRARDVRAGLELTIGARKALVFKPALGLLGVLNRSVPLSVVQSARASRGAVGD